MTPGILLDTNVYAAFKRDHPLVLDEVRRAPEIVMRPVVLGELRGGFVLDSRARENERELEAFLAGSRVRVVGVTDRTSVFYARWGALRRRARPAPAHHRRELRRDRRPCRHRSGSPCI